MKIPSNNAWIQTNTGNILGVLNETHNCSFDKKAEIMLAKKAFALIDSQTNNFADVMAILYFDDEYFVVTDDKVFSGNLSDGVFSEVASSPSLGTVSDGVVVYSRLYVSDTTALAYINTSGTWTTGIGSLTATYPHPLCVFDSLPTYKLAVGDGYQLKTYDSSGNANSTVLSLPQNYIITSLVYRNGYIYIGTKEINGGEAAVFAWNGDGTSAQYKIDVGASWVYSMTPYRSAIALVTNAGELLLLSGMSIQQLGAFPVFYAEGAQWETGNSTRGKVFNRGMVALGDRLYININGNVDHGSVPAMKSGVWCFDSDTGLTHYASNTTDLRVADDFSISNSIITTGSAHGLILGDAVVFTTLSGLSGIESGIVYYAIPVTTTTLKVAASRQSAFDGTNLTITGTKAAGLLYYAPNSNHGQLNGEQAGAIALTNYLDFPLSLYASDIIWGGSSNNNAGTERSALMVTSDRFNIGWFILQRVYTNSISQFWTTVYPFFDGIWGSVERIIVKAQSKARQSLPSREVEGVWLNTNTINTTDMVLNGVMEVGDEVVFVRGYGSGRTAHITAIDNSSSVTSITIDEDYGTVAGTSYFYVTGYKKLQTITNERENPEFAQVALNSQSVWVNVKVEMRGFETAVSMLELVNSADKKA